MNRINWLYFLLDDDKEVFVYGLSLPTNSSVLKEFKPQEIGKIGSKKILQFQSISSKKFSLSGDIKFNELHSKANHKTPIIATKSIKQIAKDVDIKKPESPVVSPIDMDIYYTGDFYHYNNAMYLDISNIKELGQIVKILEEDTGQSFKKAYSQRLGCFEFGHTQPWAEDKVSPFEVYIEPKGDTPHHYYFERNELINEILKIHLIVYNDINEILIDEVKVIKAGKKKVFFQPFINNNDARYEYWIFDKNEKLIDRNKFNFIKQISMNLNLMGNSVKISKDTLSRRSPLSDKERSVSIISHTEKSNIDFDNKNANKELQNNIEKLHKNISEYFKGINKDDYGKWFNKDEVDEFIKYLNEITSNGVYEITFIDPFISKTSLEYLLFLKNAQIKLQFISCWNNQNPDNQENSNIETIIKETQDALKKLQDYNIPLRNVTWYNCKKAQFHDRLIYLQETQTEKETVFILSNSLNSLLKKYPFSIIPLNRDVERKAIDYIKSLLNECSGDNQIYPDVN